MDHQGLGKCPVDAKNDVNGSQEQPETLEIELPASLSEALMHLACVQHQTNNLLAQIVQQNQQLLEALIDETADSEPREDMEGNPIRNS
jgi:hypothetical protein